MHILVTADTVGGVWTYTRELVCEAAGRGNRVTLVSFGLIPSGTQTAWLERLQNVTFYPTGFRLEWMPESEADISESMRYLRSVIDESKPDILHLSQFCYGALNVRQPKVVVAHSDVMSWNAAVRSCQPEDEWSRWYRKTVAAGLAAANLVVAPSRWMMGELTSCYNFGAPTRVIYNGRSPGLFNPFVGKLGYAASIGRLWDEAKQARLLTELEQPAMPIRVAGAVTAPGDLPAKSGKQNSNGLELLGERSEGEMRELLSRASVYIAASKYEPFGLAPLEAALSRCALAMSDIPTFQEVWGDAALYFRAGDAHSLSQLLTRLHQEPELRLGFANRAYERARTHYTAVRMMNEYAQAYSSLLGRRAGAA